MTRRTRVAQCVQSALLFGSLAVAANSYAQSEEDVLLEEQQSEEIQEVVEEEPMERVVTTGSRIRRQEFSSASPIQVIDGEVSRELGLFDTTEMLQNTSQSNGLQIDNTFGGFVIDNGPGSSTVGFRGLGASRTLVLINGRRVAPAGVGGAPTAPDLNLIPAVMVERVENLFDGASTIYGSDAIAGVANVILRKDVEGFDVQGSYSAPKSGGGEEKVLSVMYGNTTDNGFISVGAEYYNRARQTYGENEFLPECEGFYHETPEGEILTDYRGIGPQPSDFTNCDIFPLTNRMFVPAFWGSVYRTNGFTNTGIPNFSESSVPTDFIGLLPTWVGADTNGDGIPDGAIVDADGDGLKDFDFQDPFYNYQRSQYANSGDWVSPNERYSVFVNGEYNFQDNNNTQAFFEGMYSERHNDIFKPGPQLFPTVPATNPYNPCGVNGIDCLGVIGFPVGPQFVQPIINIRGDRDRFDVEVSQYRLLTGLTGDLGFMNDVGEGNWMYEASVAYSASDGYDRTQGIHNGRLTQSLGATMDADGNISCGDGCVPVNLFGDNIWQAGGGTLSDAEADYLFVDRTTETKVKQTVFSGFITGDLYQLPWNDEIVPAVFGVEFRKDEIESNPNDVASEGLLFGWFSDKGADGSRNMREVFTEFEFPLLRGAKYAEELTLSAAGRWTDESYYDPETTYSLKTVYRPVEWFTLRGTKGTSYRAPNLRERFLNGTTGFNTLSDPCVVPTSARDGNPLDPTAPDVYNPANDDRDQNVINSCIASGVDPTSLGIGSGDNEFTSNYSVEINTGGSLALSEERSTAKTWGVVFEQPFSEDFDLTLSATRFDIEITNSIEEPGNSFIVGQCYNNPSQPNATSGFCDRITRDPDTGRMSLLDASFVNIGLLTSKGTDYNIYYNQDFVVADRNLNVTFDLIATKMSEQFEDILGTTDDNVGEPTMPEWRANARLALTYGDFRFNWQTRFIQAGENDNPADFEADNPPCDGLDTTCRPVYYTEDYDVHNASINYSKDNYSFTVGVQNVFNDEPPKVDGAGVFSERNIPLGVGYDLFGRTAYFSFGYTF